MKKNKQNTTNEHAPIPFSMNHQIEYLARIIFQLNMLAFELPIRIEIVDDRKAYSDEWLKENGFGHIALQPKRNYTEEINQMLRENGMEHLIKPNPEDSSSTHK